MPHTYEYPRPALTVDVVVFDNELSPAQLRNLETALGRKVLGDNGKRLKAFGKLVQEFVEEEGVSEAMQEFVNPLADLGDKLNKLTMELGMKAMGNADEVGAAAVDYLRICGHLVFAYFWARMAKVALEKEGSGDPFYKAKLATARFYFAKLLPETDLPEDRLFEAMRYSALGSGKRLRPFLALASGRLCGAPRRSLASPLESRAGRSKILRRRLGGRRKDQANGDSSHADGDVGTGDRGAGPGRCAGAVAQAGGGIRTSSGRAEGPHSGAGGEAGGAVVVGVGRLGRAGPADDALAAGHAGARAAVGGARGAGPA